MAVEDVTRTRPDSRTLDEIRQDFWRTVLLHNDDHNTMDYVVVCLVKSVPSLTIERAIEIMFEAHNHGMAPVISCSLELAELYRDRILSFGLTATIRDG